jgi:branched-chain amino acid transport system permease protein
MHPARMFAVAAGAAAALLAAGLFPALVAALPRDDGGLARPRGVGIVVLMRGGGASFGQGMFFAIGAYVAALAPQALGISDGILRALLGTLAAGAVAAVFAPLLARYRGIFYAMLTLALSMVLYGILSKASKFGGTDGLTVVKPTLFGATLDVAQRRLRAVRADRVPRVRRRLGVSVYSRSVAGLLAQAVRANALRVEYLGASARRSLRHQLRAVRAARRAGGAITARRWATSSPNFTDWTTSGEFVFIAVLAGTQSVAAVFVASLLLEIVRSFSNLYFPNTGSSRSALSCCW